MRLNRKKVIEMVRNRVKDIESTFDRDVKEWNIEVLEFYQNAVHSAEKELAEKKAKLAQVRKASYDPDLDDDIAYSLNRSKPKELPDMHKKLRELVEVLEAVVEDEISVSPQIERALGLKW
jgi:hypothetical protein